MAGYGLSYAFICPSQESEVISIGADIFDVADKECNSKLILTHQTIWTNIENELKKQIIENKKANA